MLFTPSILLQNKYWNILYSTCSFIAFRLIYTTENISDAQAKLYRHWFFLPHALSSYRIRSASTNMRVSDWVWWGAAHASTKSLKFVEHFSTWCTLDMQYKGSAWCGCSSDSYNGTTRTVIMRLVRHPNNLKGSWDPARIWTQVCMHAELLHAICSYVPSEICSRKWDGIYPYRHMQLTSWARSLLDMVHISSARWVLSSL